MSRISKLFESLKAENNTALIPFITAGDPHPDYTVSIMHGLVEGGANIIELGIPFSDPMADGPVIQRASERALEHHISLKDVLVMVTQFRETNNTTPVVLMGYMNPIEVMGYSEFVEAAVQASVDGVLIVDLPPEEANELTQILNQHQMDQVFLIAPTTVDERLQVICDAASGFVYYVSLKGVTGSNRFDINEVSDKLNQIRSKTSLPIGVGFGIKDAETAAAVAKISEAVVVGSALVEHLYSKAEQPELLQQTAMDFLSEMSSAMKAV